MLYNWRINRLERRITKYDLIQKNIQQRLDKGDWSNILFANGTSVEDANAVIINLSERRMRLQKKIEKIRVARFKKSLPEMFK